ncbi:hypothetical protein KNO15_00120 [Leifsonia shinshuensis]|uniref:WapI family immunity protein n=1 Tax=Leifsonia shinshuensis TaxID=150026 RepID=UPI001F50CCE5|nr:hypothetical protein [Leifsonia shinshuensis]MCI0155107.1 hypothetical protein [Leifsonia shinshuensis]
MRMHSGGSSVELSIEGYEFPERLPSGGLFDHDANWLLVRGALQVSGVHWSFVDPCLLTVEAQSLLNWLHEVAGGGSPEALCFLEPNLAFDLDGSTAEGVALRVSFSHESAAPRALEAPRHIILNAALSDVARAADEWASELVAYPVR